MTSLYHRCLYNIIGMKQCRNGIQHAIRSPTMTALISVRYLMPTHHMHMVYRYRQVYLLNIFAFQCIFLLSLNINMVANNTVINRKNRNVLDLLFLLNSFQRNTYIHMKIWIYLIPIQCHMHLQYELFKIPFVRWAKNIPLSTSQILIPSFSIP